VSVIVPTRDRAEYLDQSLASLAVQVCEAALEFIVVDNASTDQTSAVVERWRAKDPRFRPIHEERLGKSRAMNAGAASARGSLLLFTDDDVVAEPEWAETIRRFFTDGPEDAAIVGGPIVPVADDLLPWPSWVAPAALADLGALEWGPVERSLGTYEHLWGANLALPSDAFVRFGPWDETIGRRGDDRGMDEDVEYQERIRAAGGTVWFCPGARVFHRVSRLDVTPRRVLTTSFSRGRNEFWRTRKLGVPATVEEGEQRGLSASFGAWSRRTLALRRRVRRDRVEAARVAAFSAGWAMERAIDGLDLGAGKRFVRTVAWSSSRAILRLTPSATARGEKQSA